MQGAGLVVVACSHEKEMAGSKEVWFCIVVNVSFSWLCSICQVQIYSTCTVDYRLITTNNHLHIPLLNTSHECVFLVVAKQSC
jgi:hypothetical protein